jgi:hypothetical protein
MIDYESVTLDQIDTTKFFVDIKQRGFVSYLKRLNNKFDVRVPNVTTDSILKYIALLYDPKSEIRTVISHYPTRKRIAAKLAGFVLDEEGHFLKEAEDLIWGQNPKVNDAIVQYGFYSSLNIFYVAHAAYTDMYFRELAVHPSHWMLS